MRKQSGTFSPSDKSFHQSNGFTNEPPYDLSHRFQNLSDPLSFIENHHITSLRNKFEDSKGQLKKEKDYHVQFSKNIYKKVISRDNDYNFNKGFADYSDPNDIAQKFSMKFSKLGEIQKSQSKVKKEDLERKFKHGENTLSTEQKIEREREKKQIPITFAHIKQLDSPDFFQKNKDIEFYQILKNQRNSEDNHQPHSSATHDLNESVPILHHIDLFKHKLIEDSQFFTKNSFNFLFDWSRQLKFWKRNVNFTPQAKTQQKILSTCAFLDSFNISIFEIFDFATCNIEIDDICQFYKLKNKLMMKMEQDKNNENLEEEYYKLKNTFEEKKKLKMQMKNQRIPIKSRNNEAQTNDSLKEREFETYFIEDATNIFLRLKELNAIRDRIIENETQPALGVMIKNLSIEINKELFKLLLLMLKGENLQNQTDYLYTENQDDVEKKILELIYMEFAKFKQYEVNGISKFEIIKIYLEERQNNERFYETYVFKTNDK